MRQKLTDTIVKDLPTPATGNRVFYDDNAQARGFGVRVTASGARSFILNYRTKAGRERRYTIGQFPAWKTSPARQEAIALRRRVDVGEDPMGEVQSKRTAPRMADLWTDFETKHLPKLRPATVSDYTRLWKSHIGPEMRTMAVGEVQYEDVDRLHRKITASGSPYAANRAVAVLRKMFTLAIRWRWRADNPAKGLELNQETKRATYLKPAEIKALSAALAEVEDQQGANIIRLLMLTGARRGEVLTMRWDQLERSPTSLDRIRMRRSSWRIRWG